ncbi:hypothetical protein GCM10009682_24570 [Luedemannella flava]|uniref:Uncharacterized protein n=2 Tax=Luedemannella flava TaxID=349316 RepID=A0ABN2LX04_9ACTN
MHIRRYVGLAALTLLAAGCGNPAARSGPPAPDASGASPVPSLVLVDPVCGQPLPDRPGGSLTVTGRFPASAPADQATIAGTVEVTGREAVRGVSGRGAEVFVVRDGRVVAVPGWQDAAGVVWDLAPGSSKSLPADVTPGTCRPLTPGTYELYARVVVTADDGARIQGVGGPWPLELR